MGGGKIFRVEIGPITWTRVFSLTVVVESKVNTLVILIGQDAVLNNPSSTADSIIVDVLVR